MGDGTYDVVVIGAGAAGLAAADALAHAGRSVLVLEARHRVGGRAWTCRMAGLDLPVELGAEFVHGEAPMTYRLLARAGMHAVSSGHLQRCVVRKRLVAVDSFEEAHRVTKGARIPDGADLSFEALLRARRGLAPRTRMLARLVVEGFDAADPREASARAIAEEWAGGQMSGTQPRLAQGYGALMGWLAQRLLARGARLRMGAAVREVLWRPRHVEVRGDGFGFAARQAVVTLPLGVLQAGSVRFVPALGKEKALRALASGPVVKAALRFPSAFWQKRYRGISFFHAPGAPFPTFWTPLPARRPLLIAWAGGPNADRLAGKDLRPRLLSSLQRIFGRIEEPDDLLVHDWRADPFARGAYSYVRVGGEGAREALLAPLEETLYFAGEATSRDDSGTVGGALQSGLDAARAITRRRVPAAGRT